MAVPSGSLLGMFTLGVDMLAASGYTAAGPGVRQLVGRSGGTTATVGGLGYAPPPLQLTVGVAGATAVTGDLRAGAMLGVASGVATASSSLVEIAVLAGNTSGAGSARVAVLGRALGLRTSVVGTAVTTGLLAPRRGLTPGPVHGVASVAAHSLLAYVRLAVQTIAGLAASAATQLDVQSPIPSPLVVSRPGVRPVDTRVRFA